jgi:hypothetical protein
LELPVCWLDLVEQSSVAPPHDDMSLFIMPPINIKGVRSMNWAVIAQLIFSSEDGSFL